MRVFLILIIFAAVGCISKQEDEFEHDPKIIGAWIKDNHNPPIYWKNSFEFKTDGTVLSDYWGYDLEENVSSTQINGKYVSESYRWIPPDSLEFTIQKDIDSYRRIQTKYKIEGDTLFVWNMKSTFYHVEDGVYISKSTDSSYIVEMRPYAKRSAKFEFH